MIQDYKGINWTIQVYTGLYRTIYYDYTELYRTMTIQNYTGLYRTIQDYADYTRLYRTLQVNKTIQN